MGASLLLVVIELEPGVKWDCVDALISNIVQYFTISKLVCW